MSAFHLDPIFIADLAQRLFGPPNRRLSTTHELRFGRRGSVAVVPSRGVFRDYEAGASGGVLAMVVHAGAAATTAEAARLLERYGAIPARESPLERREREERDNADQAHRRAVAASLWAAATPIDGSPVETYLRRARAIAAPLGGASIGWLANAPVHPYATGDRICRPAMVAAVVNANRQLIGAHLTYLAPGGTGKADDLATPRKMVGVVGGGFVPLAAGSRLVVAEGIESALSAWEAVGGSREDIGCVAGLSAGGLAGLTWPTATRELIIAPDRDTNGAGESAAHALALRAWRTGLTVGFLRPPQAFADWNAAATRGLDR